MFHKSIAGLCRSKEQIPSAVILNDQTLTRYTRLKSEKNLAMFNVHMASSLAPCTWLLW